MAKMIINMQFLLSLEMFKIMGFELDNEQMTYESSTYEFKFVYVIVVIFLA